MKGSVYLMMDFRSNTVALSADGLRGQMATIDHHPTADLRASRHSLPRPRDSAALNSCLTPALFPHRLNLRLPPLFLSRPTTLLLHLLVPRLAPEAQIWEAT